MMLLLHIFFAVLPFQLSLGGISTARILALGIAVILAVDIFRTRRVTIIPLPALLIGLLLSILILSGLVAQDHHWWVRKIIFLGNIFVLAAALMTRTGAEHRALIQTAVYSGMGAAALLLLLWGAQFIVGTNTIDAVWRTVMAPILFGADVSSALTIYSSAYVHIGGQDYLRGVGLFPDPHVAAAYMVLLIPPAIALYRHAAHPIRFGLGIALLFGALFSTFTRGAYVALVGCGMVALAIGIRHAIRNGVIHLHLRDAVLVGMGMIAIIVAIIATPLGNRIGDIFTADTSVRERLSIYRDSAAIALDHPILGVGLGNYPLMINPHADYRDPYYAHNLFLDLAVDGGFAAALCIAALLIAAIYRARCVRMGAALGASVAGYTTHNLFDTILFSTHVLPLLLLLLMAIFAQRCILKS